MSAPRDGARASEVEHAAMIPESEWRWYGLAGHLIVGNWCRFHLCTVVGDYLVSTVGKWVHPSDSKGSEQEDARFLEKHPNGKEIGCDRFYETMVFRAGKGCTQPGCACGQPTIEGSSLDFEGYNTVKAATVGHRAMCLKWARGGVA